MESVQPQKVISPYQNPPLSWNWPSLLADLTASGCPAVPVTEKRPSALVLMPPPPSTVCQSRERLPARRFDESNSIATAVGRICFMGFSQVAGFVSKESMADRCRPSVGSDGHGFCDRHRL